MIDARVNALDPNGLGFARATAAIASRVTRLKEKIGELREEMGCLQVLEQQMMASPDEQVSFTDPDARSMATSERGSGLVGYNVQVAVERARSLPARRRCGDRQRAVGFG